MSTESYLLEITSATEKQAKLGLYKFLYVQYVNRAGLLEDQATLLAVAVTNRIFGEKPTGDANVDFARQAAALVDNHARKLASDDALCRCLSGAAYNTAYGRYIAAGGKRALFSNRFLAYVRTLSRLQDSDYRQISKENAAKVTALGETILAPIEAMLSLGIFRPLSDNPNEREFFDAAHQLASDTDALTRS